MRRFFISSEQADSLATAGRTTLQGGDVRHIVSVLRAGPGDQLTLCDSSGREFVTEILRCEREAVEVRNVETVHNETEPRVRVTVIQGIAKGEKMDVIIQKCVELGAVALVPVETEHTVVRLGPEDRAKKQARWQKIAEAAAKQSGRGIVPEILRPCTLKEALAQRPEGELKLFAYENEDRNTLKAALLRAGADYAGGMSVLIGPEGGFSHAEAELAEAAGFEAVTLGKRILRTETAGPAVLAALRCFFED